MRYFIICLVIVCFFVLGIIIFGINHDLSRANDVSLIHDYYESRDFVVIDVSGQRSEEGNRYLVEMLNGLNEIVKVVDTEVVILDSNEK